MKAIKNSKSNRLYAVVFVLMSILLLSSTMQIVVWAKGKPTNPGKPVETWDLTIYIGESGEDIVLIEPDYLLAEDVPCSGGLWNFPTHPKGKTNRGNYVSAQFTLHKWYDETTGEWLGDECGTCELPAALDSFQLDDYEIFEVDIGHQVNPMDEDYWWFRIIWTSPLPDPNSWQSYTLWIWTNADGNPEVTPPEGNVLAIPFNGATAMFFSDWPDTTPPHEEPSNYEWTGSVSFTITIVRSPHLT